MELTYSIPTIGNGVIFTGHKNLPASKEESTYSSPTIVNGVTSTHTSVELVSSRNDKIIVSDSEVSNRRRSKVVILSDSHLKGCTERIDNHLKDKFRTIGWIKPRALAEEILDKQTVDLVNLKKKT